MLSGQVQVSVFVYDVDESEKLKIEDVANRFHQVNDGERLSQVAGSDEGLEHSDEIATLNDESHLSEITTIDQYFAVERKIESRDLS